MPVGAIVAQCGGPTAVINASLAAVIAAWQTTPGIGTLWGSRFGMHGLAHGRYSPTAVAHDSGGFWSLNCARHK